MRLQRELIPAIYAFSGLMAGTALGFDDFNAQMSKIAHEETSWRHDIFTTADSATLWKSDSVWFQKPALTLRFNVTHEERSFPRIATPGGGFTSAFAPDPDLWTPMIGGSFQTWGGLDIGIVHAHSYQSVHLRVPIPSGSRATVESDNELDSMGGYFAKQWDCGFKAVATWSYTWTEGDGFLFQEFDTGGASGALGFARSFGEKKIGRNIFVDSSANFLYQSEEETWHFLWLAKVGHSICPRVAVYGIFNLFQQLDDGSGWPVPLGQRGYHPLHDETWGEAGGGVQTQLPWGVSLFAEATTPVMDEGIPADNAFQVRAAINWRF